MPQPEAAVKKFLKKSIAELAAAHELNYFVDTPPASIYGNAGRPDCFIDLGPYHLRVEVKTDKGKLSELQKHYLERHRADHGLNCTVVYGRSGVSQLVIHLYDIIDADASIDLANAYQ